jgi:hypothetical protein
VYIGDVEEEDNYNNDETIDDIYEAVHCDDDDDDDNHDDNDDDDYDNDDDENDNDNDNDYEDDKIDVMMLTMMVTTLRTMAMLMMMMFQGRNVCVGVGQVDHPRKQRFHTSAVFGCLQGK